MKKLVFIMPLMAASLLASCNNGNKTIERTVSFNIPGCKMFYGETEITSGGTKIELPIASPYYVKFSVKTNEDNYMKPSAVTLDKATEYTFYKEYGDLYINLQSDIAVTGICDTYKTIEECAWAGISTASRDGVADEVYKVGQTKTVMVNNQPHKVRIIGFNQDKDKDGNEIGITFEFADLISDEAGYSLVTQWNDTNDADTANHNYLNSSIRYALNKETGEGGCDHILWAQKGNEHWSNESGGPYTNKSVLEMLPSELTDVLVAPKKTVQCYKNGEWSDTPIVNNSGKYDKLFLLSPEEMGSNADRAGAYTYYQETDSDKLTRSRIKKQIKGNEVLTSTTYISDTTGQVCTESVCNYAGYNCESGATGGGISWLRSPNIRSGISFSTLAWRNYSDGSLGDVGYVVYMRALAVAPAFCI